MAGAFASGPRPLPTPRCGIAAAETEYRQVAGNQLFGARYMKVNGLASPGLLSNGIKLRVEAAKAISSVQLTALRTPGGKTRAGKTLADFFTACADALSTYFDVTVPTVSSRVATASTTCKITFSETMDETVTPAAAAFTSSGNTITAVAWGTSGDAGKLILTGTGFASGENMTYTKPATNFLRDRAGNVLATTSANMT
jgi:hypothetical protein